MVKTEILGIEVDETKRELWVPIGTKYYLLLKKWWDHFGLKGRGLMIGEPNEAWSSTHRHLIEIYPEIRSITTADMYEGCDFAWDITYPAHKFLHPSDFVYFNFNFINCQAVLEHVVSPAEAIGNLSDQLREDGLLFIHTCGPEVEEHRYPIDCVRFYRDFFIACADRFRLKIEDLLWTPKYCYVVYRRVF